MLKATIPVFILFFSSLLNAQQLPDAALAVRMNVKALLILRYDGQTRLDTFSVYRLQNGKWDDGHAHDPIARPEIKPDTNDILLKDEKGRIVLQGRKRFYTRNGKPVADTLAMAYAYDERDSLLSITNIRMNMYEAITKRCIFYDSTGRRILVSEIFPNPDQSVTRTEYRYDSLGRLESVSEWWTMQTHETKRSQNDYLVTRITYRYLPNGLIGEAFAEDPFHQDYCSQLNGYKAEDPVFPPEKLTLRYIYVY